MSGRLNGKYILVTGGSRGIGAGIAKALAAQGAHVALTFTSKPESAEKVLSELPGQGHMAVRMDISDAISVQQGFDEVFKSFDKLDGLVNNAGITRDQLILRMKDEDFDSVVHTNLRGTYLCCKAAVKAMLKSRSGSIVNISSVIASMGNAGQTNYAASKGGVEAFSRSLAQEVASRSIRINCIAPGFIVTDMSDAIDPKMQEAILKKIPLGRFGQVIDVAQAATFLLSDESSYVTGQVLHVNGGLYM